MLFDLFNHHEDLRPFSYPGSWFQIASQSYPMNKMKCFHSKWHFKPSFLAQMDCLIILNLVNLMLDSNLVH